MKRFIKYCLIGVIGLIAMYLFIDLMIDQYIKELDLIAQYNQEYYNKMY